ncbi:MAG: hypothetical protein WCZ86_10460 [Desulfurivibrionaceae bacterium]
MASGQAAQVIVGIAQGTPAKGVIHVGNRGGHPLNWNFTGI